MGSVSKTLSLLNHLSAARPEMGLTEFQKASGFDKATTYRRLRELEEAGFLDQDPVRKTYRLGPAIVRLALVREQSFPAEKAAMGVLEQLYAELSETVHVSVRQGLAGLSTFAHIDDKTHGNRVYIDPAEILPYHATASGLVVLAHSDPGLVAQVLAQPLVASAPGAETDAAAIAAHIDTIRETGFGLSEGWFEADVIGLSAPVFDRNGDCSGAVAAAGPSGRMGQERRPAIRAALARAATVLTENQGGRVPEQVRAAWSAVDQVHG